MRVRSSQMRPSVSLSVTLRYCGHIVWDSRKIITHIVRLGSSLLAPNTINLVQVEHPKILGGIGVRRGKKWVFRAQKL